MDETLVKTNEQSFRPMNVIRHNISFFVSALYSTGKLFYVSIRSSLYLLVTFGKADCIFHISTTQVHCMSAISHLDHKVYNCLYMTTLTYILDSFLLEY